MNLKSRANEIQFREDYTPKNWEEDAEFADLLLQAIPKGENRDYLADLWVLMANNTKRPPKEKVKLWLGQWQSHVDKKTFLAMPKEKAKQLIAFLKSHLPNHRAVGEMERAFWRMRHK